MRLIRDSSSLAVVVIAIILVHVIVILVAIRIAIIIRAFITTSFCATASHRVPSCLPAFPS